MIPYMGSKRKYAKEILSVIKQQNPNAKYFYDLFGGGGAISIEALNHFDNVYYNELNTGVVELLKKIQQDGVTPDFYEWVDRETFNTYKNEDTWFGGLVKTCWSFGNNQKDYLYGKDIEGIKKEAHDYLFANGYDFTKESRIRLIKEFKEEESINGRFRLQSLERLQSLQSLERLQSLEISNLSYEKVLIATPIEETVIYCDPPYKNTGTYQKDIDHNAFEQWVKESPYTIYVSSYEFDLPCVWKRETRSSLSATNNSKKVVEKLFVNR